MNRKEDLINLRMNLPFPQFKCQPSSNPKIKSTRIYQYSLYRVLAKQQLLRALQYTEFIDTGQVILEGNRGPFKEGMAVVSGCFV